MRIIINIIFDRIFNPRVMYLIDLNLNKITVTLRRASKLGDQLRKDQYCAHITGLLYSTILNIEERTKVRRRKGKVYILIEVNITRGNIL